MKVKTLICCTLLFIASACLTLAQEVDGLFMPKAEEKIQTLPSAYCMRDDYILYAQNQDDHGLCWNFAATMSATTTLMKATGEYYDFSELWTTTALYNFDNSYTTMGNGGDFTLQRESMQASGLMLECDLPYQNAYTDANETATDYYNFYFKHANVNLASCLQYDKKESSFSKKEIDRIKEHICNYGSVYMTIAFRQGFVKGNGAYYLPPNQKNTNSLHALSVIGWDDNYQMEVYLDGSDTPTLFKGAWLVLNSYTEKSGTDGLSFIFYEDENVGSALNGYRYVTNTEKDLYFYDKIESGYAYPTNVKGKYYGNFVAETGTTKQKNIFNDNVDLEYSYIISDGAEIERIDIYLDNDNVTGKFNVRVDEEKKTFAISKANADYGQYKVLVTYGNGVKSDTYLNNFFVTYGLIGEQIEFDYENNTLAFNTGRDLEYYSYASSEKKYVIYTNQTSGTLSFLPTEQSVYSDKNMSIPTLSYSITDGEECILTHTITANSGHTLSYNFIFEYYEDASLQPVTVHYDLGGGTNHAKNYGKELASPTKDLVLCAPTREGYTFKGWYLDYGSGSEKVPQVGDEYCVSWENILHLGENPGLFAKGAYGKYYKNSNLLFVYARWEEVEYYNASVEILGEGKTQIAEDISFESGEKLHYIFTPSEGWCLSGMMLDGEPISKDDLPNIIHNGLRLDNLRKDVSISATFTEGVYLSLRYGENIKTAYLVMKEDKDERRFYNGDCIPAEYLVSNYTNTFYLVVEVAENREGYTYVLDGVKNYVALGNGLFRKELTVQKKPQIKEIDVGSAVGKPIEKVTLKYNVGLYILDHYISDDSNAKSGQKGSGVYEAGQVVYIFLKKQADTPEYKYVFSNDFNDNGFGGKEFEIEIGNKPFFPLDKLVEGSISSDKRLDLPFYSLFPEREFVAVGEDWYRLAVYVNADDPMVGTIRATRQYASYSVLWKNWDGEIIYADEYRYKETPEYLNEDKDGNNIYPTKPSDETYSYTFVGWDIAIEPITQDTIYIAVFEAVLRQYAINVEQTEHGSIIADGENYITHLDQRTYTFTPDEGYTIKEVFLNGVSIGSVSSYTFTGISEDQTLRVEFEKLVTENMDSSALSSDSEKEDEESDKTIWIVAFSVVGTLSIGVIVFFVIQKKRIVKP